MVYVVSILIIASVIGRLHVVLIVQILSLSGGVVSDAVFHVTDSNTKYHIDAVLKLPVAEEIWLLEHLKVATESQ